MVKLLNEWWRARSGGGSTLVDEGGWEILPDGGELVDGGEVFIKGGAKLAACFEVAAGPVTEGCEMSARLEDVGYCLEE